MFVVAVFWYPFTKFDTILYKEIDSVQKLEFWKMEW